jgi:hypothetical protein
MAAMRCAESLRRFVMAHLDGESCGGRAARDRHQADLRL